MTDETARPVPQGTQAHIWQNDRTPATGANCGQTAATLIGRGEVTGVCRGKPVSQGTEDSPDVREQIARTLHDAATGRIVPDPTDPTPYGRMARQVYDEVFAPLVEQLRQARRMLHHQRVGVIA